MGLEDLLGAALELPIEARARLVHELQLSIVDESRTVESPRTLDREPGDPELTEELGRRLEALQRGEARTVTRAEMKLRLARGRAARASR